MHNSDLSFFRLTKCLIKSLDLHYASHSKTQEEMCADLNALLNLNCFEDVPEDGEFSKKAVRKSMRKTIIVSVKSENQTLVIVIFLCF